MNRSSRKIVTADSPGVYLPLYDAEDDKNRDVVAAGDYGSIQLGRRRGELDKDYGTDEDPYENFSDTEAQRWKSTDDFGEFHNVAYSSARTGRHRRKLAARTKGGEFQASRRKRRLYFCCMGIEIDIQAVHDHLCEAEGWSLKLYGDALRLFRPGLNNPNIRQSVDEVDSSYQQQQDSSETNIKIKSPVSISLVEKIKKVIENSSSMGAQEVYIFEFGAAVFWGFPKGDEKPLLSFVKEFVTNGLLVKAEFEEGEDDIGFVTSREVDCISIANDVITMPENAVEKQRLAISYAIAQSTVLAIFEARVEKKVEEYKYIPETLAARGQINLTHQKIGRMIGEIFVVRHDVNLHTVVLDTPDFFWKEEKYEIEYRMMMRYLEMSERVDTVNKRLDMLKELLDVLEQQLESAHASKLEWIVIWLIIIEIAIEFLGIAGEVLGIWSL